jgi:solute carrier family 7 (cationic amino acid transporter), member 1
LPFFLGRVEVPWLGIIVDPCATIFVLIVTVLLSWNKGGTYRIGYLTSTLPSFPCRSYNLIFALSHLQSSLVQVTMTVANVIAMLFVIIAGGYLGFQTGWKGYSVPGG